MESLLSIAVLVLPGMGALALSDRGRSGRRFGAALAAGALLVACVFVLAALISDPGDSDRRALALASGAFVFTVAYGLGWLTRLAASARWR